MARNHMASAILVAMTSLAMGACETVYHAVAGPNRDPSSVQTIDDADREGRTASLPTCDGSAGCFGVMTYNLKHRDVPLQLDAIAKALPATCANLPDFILLQEVVCDRPAAKGLDSTAAELAARLGYQCRSEARDGGDEGVAILSRMPFAHYDFLHISARDGLLSGGFPRVSVMGEFDVSGIGRVRIVNVHLTARASQADIRSAQLKETLDWMNARQREVAADVIILGGDFNFEPGATEGEMLRDPSACGGLQFADHNSRIATSGKIGNLYARVDYFFIASPTKPIRSVGEGILWPDGVPTIDGSTTFWPSDHLPLLHIFAVGQ